MVWSRVHQHQWRADDVDPANLAAGWPARTVGSPTLTLRVGAIVDRARPTDGITVPAGLENGALRGTPTDLLPQNFPVYSVTDVTLDIPAGELVVARLVFRHPVSPQPAFGLTPLGYGAIANCLIRAVVNPDSPNRSARVFTNISASNPPPVSVSVDGWSVFDLVLLPDNETAIMRVNGAQVEWTIFPPRTSASGVFTLLQGGGVDLLAASVDIGVSAEWALTPGAHRLDVTEAGLVRLDVSPPAPEASDPVSPFNYARLLEDALTYSARTNLRTEIRPMADAIHMRIRRDVRAQEQELRAVFTAAEATPNEIRLPSNFLGARSVTTTVPFRRTLERYSPELIRESRFWDASGEPKAYSVERGRLVLAPRPVGPVSVEVVYFASFDRLEEAEDTNWLLQNAYDLFLYALVAEIFRYSQDLPMANEFERQYEQALARFMDREKQSRYGGSAFIRPRTGVV